MSDENVTIWRMEMGVPTPHQGLNFTVRNGSKWASAKAGDEILIFARDSGQQIASGTIVVVQESTFERLPEPWLNYAYDKTARSPDGMRKALDRAYGEGQWGPTVTGVLFMADLPVDEVRAFQTPVFEPKLPKLMEFEVPQALRDEAQAAMDAQSRREPPPGWDPDVAQRRAEESIEEIRLGMQALSDKDLYNARQVIKNKFDKNEYEAMDILALDISCQELEARGLFRLESSLEPSRAEVLAWIQRRNPGEKFDFNREGEP